MQLKTASKLAIGCLSLGAVLTLTRDIWTHRLLVMGIFDHMGTLSLFTSALEVLLFHLPLIVFFVVLNRHQSNRAPS